MQACNPQQGCSTRCQCIGSIILKHYYKCFVTKYVVQRQQKQTIENHLLFKTRSLKIFHRQQNQRDFYTFFPMVVGTSLTTTTTYCHEQITWKHVNKDLTIKTAFALTMNFKQIPTKGHEPLSPFLNQAFLKDVSHVVGMLEVLREALRYQADPYSHHLASLMV